GYKYFIVRNEDIVQKVEIAGSVQSSSFADLSFQVSGKVTDVNVDIGYVVNKGDIIATLDTSELEADLDDALSFVEIKKVELDNNISNLDNVMSQQEVIVSNAKNKLLSSDLEAIPRSRTNTLDRLIVTGKYSGEEGSYKIKIENTVNSINTKLEVFGLERFTGIIESTRSNPLGTSGLFIRLPSDASGYLDTIWTVDIPNIKGDNYTTNINTYKKSLEDKVLAIEESKKNIYSGNQQYSIAFSELKQAEAKVAKIRSQISKHKIISPFTGEISAIDIELGEVSSPGSIVASIISNGGFEIVLDVPEVDISKVKVGDDALIFIDSFNEEEGLYGKIIAVSRGSRYVDGIPVYETIVSLDSEDERMRSGLSATVDLLTDKSDAAMAVPNEYVQRDEDGEFVLMDNGDDFEKRYIKVGIRGTNGMVEILSGLYFEDKVFFEVKK
ncbi:MAG: HlyD family secretion protein, partial [Candidatus Paceibacteria bacterium]